MKMYNKRKIFKYKFCRLIGDDLWGYYYKNIKQTKIKLYFRDLFETRKLRKKALKTPFTYNLDPKQKVEKKFKRRTLYFKTLFNQQKFKRYYSNITVKQIKKNLGLILNKNYNILDHFAYYFEMRLDSVLVRANFAYSFPHARQIIKHGFILVNGTKVTYTGFLLKRGDCIEVCALKKNYLYNILKNRLEALMVITSAPKYLDVDYSLMSCIILSRVLYKNVPLLKNFNISNLLNI